MDGPNMVYVFDLMFKFVKNLKIMDLVFIFNNFFPTIADISQVF